MSTVTVLDSMQKPSLQEFGRIFEQYYDLVYRTAYSITGTPQDAEDVVQTIFLRLLRRESPPPDLTKNPRGYFYRAAVNASLKTLRFRARHVVLLSPDAEPARVESGAGNLDQAHCDDDMNRRLWQAIAELNETAAQIVILRYIENCSLSEIARVLGTTRSTVAVSLFRSRARLKKLIRASKDKQS
jgi:RNA polymerase sigma-70 factor, ECF subfamily